MINTDAAEKATTATTKYNHRSLPLNSMTACSAVSPPPPVITKIKPRGSITTATTMVVHSQIIRYCLQERFILELFHLVVGRSHSRTTFMEMAKLVFSMSLPSLARSIPQVTTPMTRPAWPSF